jgi:outer membrane protein TolC
VALLRSDVQYRLRRAGVSAAWLAALLFVPTGAALELHDAVEMAQRNDPWLRGSEFRQQAVAENSVAAGELPDPVVTVGFANLPTDTFDFNQEPMTQFKVGITQEFPRGESRALQRKRLSLLGAQHPLQRADRQARVAVQVTGLWLECWQAQETIRLIEEHRHLFEHLVDVAESSYVNTLGRTRQQELVRAQLELTRLEDRLTVLHQQLETSRAGLGEWVSRDPSPPGTGLSLPVTLPQLALTDPAVLSAAHPELAPLLLAHPAIRSLETRVEAQEAGIALAEQKYKPKWSVNASYGYRDDDPLGTDRADFFSIGVSFDLPLFPAQRQDREVQSAIATTEAVRTEKALALRSMLAALETQRARLLRLEQRRTLYRSRLLSEIHEQAEASLTAYTNDEGDFAEVVRARIAELNARIDAVAIEVERLKTISQLNYFLVGSAAQTEEGRS